MEKFGIRGILDAANVESNKISGRRYDPITGHDAIITTVGSDFKVLIGDSGDGISNDPPPPLSLVPRPSFLLPLPYPPVQDQTSTYIHNQYKITHLFVKKCKIILVFMHF